MIDRHATDAESSGQPSHFAALDSLRGIAALSVVLFHISWINSVESLNYVRNSYLMVDLFFVLSGFVISYSYGGRIRTSIDAVRFMWLRFWRLYPLHFAFLIVFLFIECLKAIGQSRFGIVAHNPPFSSNNFLSFVGNLLLIQSLHVFPKLTFNGPAWSISVEFYTYIVFALVVLGAAGKRSMLLTSASICAIGLVVLVRLGPLSVADTFDFGIFRCLAGFFLGALMFAASEYLRSLAAIRSRGRLVGWFALAMLASFVAFLALKHQGYSDLGIYPASAAVVLLVALSPVNGAIRFLSTPPFLWLGTVSYSIYMAHAAVEWGVNQVLRFATHAKEIVLPLHDTPVLVPGNVTGLCAVAVTLVLVLFVSHFTYAWIEKPFRDWSKAAWPSRSTRTVESATIESADAGNS